IRVVLALEMGGRRVRGSVLGWVWRRRMAVRAALEDAGFGTEARNQNQPKGSRQRSGPLGDQPFSGLLSKNLSREALVDGLWAAVVDRKGEGLVIISNKGNLTCFSGGGLGDSPGVSVWPEAGQETSGLVLLSSCPQTTSHLRKFFIHARRAQRPTATYCHDVISSCPFLSAVTNGIQATSEGKIQTALKLEHIDGVNLDIMEGVKKTLSHFSVLATGSGRALVQLQPLTVFSNQLQVHMVLQLCPVLGDHTYSAHVGTVLGHTKCETQ
uniref:Pseudouridine synthase RsuA/RluA-like domain-containing protein n=1 Tax=Aotus nancymaae TaxID=37293 RepID=A0A2K5BWQ9_AOTNA